jgi:endonuclease/exonuclease/phosphatase family metal-dependent hydrolase
MKLVSINIELNKHYKTVLDFLKQENPDVICLQELLGDDFENFKKVLGKQGIFKPRTRIGDDLRLQDIKEKKEGVAIFANHIVDSGSIYYEGCEENLLKTYSEYITGENNKNSVLLWIDTNSSDGKSYRFATTHVPVTKGGESTPYQLEVIDLLLKELGSLGEFVLCGDMNAPRGKETFSRIAKKYKDNIPEEYKTSLDQNLHRVKNLQHMVDGLFTTTKYQASNVKLIDGISDHMAIVADINKVI